MENNEKIKKEPVLKEKIFNINDEDFGELDIAEQVDIERVKISSKYDLHPDLSHKEFSVNPVVVKQFGTIVTMLGVKLHPHWVKKIELSDSDQAFINLLGLEKQYVAKVGLLQSRKKNKQGVEYFGISIFVEDEIINCPFDVADFKNLKLLRFIKERN